MKKALLTATVQHHFTSFHLPLIDLLHEHGYEVHVAARDVMGEAIRTKLEASADRVFDLPFGRSPLDTTNLTAYKELKKIIRENDYDVIHCNTPVGGILTRLAARRVRKSGTTVIYTAHGFHFYKGASKLGWLLFYPIEKIFGRSWTDCLITICDEDEKTARTHHICRNIRRSHGVGAKAERFAPVSEEEKRALRKELGLDESAVLCLCTGELNANKNQKQLVEATKQVLSACPDFCLLCAGVGDTEQALQVQIEALGLQKSVRLLGYRTDIDKVVKASDFVSSVSLREGLPVNIIEGMLCAKPAVATHNRGHNELICDGVSGYLVNPGDVDATAAALTALAVQPDLREQMGLAAQERSAVYSTQSVMREVEQIYNEFVFNKVKAVK